jgi:hypothetical protein
MCTTINVPIGKSYVCMYRNEEEVEYNPNAQLYQSYWSFKEIVKVL